MGFKVYDADTHLRPSAESIRPYLPSSVLERIPDLEEQRVPIRMTMARERLEPPYRHWYRFRGAEAEEGWGTAAARVLGEPAPRESERVPQKFMGAKFPAKFSGDDDAVGRLRDMDEEGVDVHFMVSGNGADHPDAELRMEFIRAAHRFLDDFCSADPHRLKTAITITPRDVEGSVREIKRWGPSPCNALTLVVREVPGMSRRTSERPPLPAGGPTLTEVELNRFCIALLDWDGVHVVGEERFGRMLRVLLADEADHEEWCHSLDACIAFRDRYGLRV